MMARSFYCYVQVDHAAVVYYGVSTERIGEISNGYYAESLYGYDAGFDGRRSVGTFCGIW